jgi:hypothetical protein
MPARLKVVIGSRDGEKSRGMAGGRIEIVVLIAKAGVSLRRPDSLSGRGRKDEKEKRARAV